MDQNIIDVGWNYDEFDKETQVIIERLTQVYNLGKKVSEQSIKPGSMGGYTELKQNIEATAKLSDEQNKLAAAYKATEAAQTKTKTSSAAMAKASRDEQKNAAALANEYQILGKAVKEAEQRYYNLALTQGRNSPLAKQALVDATKLKDIQIELNRDTRIYTDNVGNYASAFTGYANTLRGLRGPTKLLGEALGIGAQEADQFRIVVEHSMQGIAAYFRAKEAGASNTIAVAAAQHLETEALIENTAALHENNVALAENFTLIQTKEEIIAESVAILEAEAVALQEQSIVIDELVLASAGLITEKQALVLAEAEVTAAFEAEAITQGEVSSAAIANIVITDTQIAANNVLTATTVNATIAQKAFRVALISTGIGVAIALIAGLVYAIHEYTESVKEANHQRKLLNELEKDAAEDAGKELGALKESKAVIEDVNVSMKTRLTAIKNIKDEYPTYFEGLSNEKILTGDIADAYDRAAAAIIRKAKAEAASAEIAKLSGKQLAIDLEAARDVKETIDLIGKAKPVVQGGTGGTGGAGAGVHETVGEVQAKIQAYYVQRKEARDKEKAELQKDLDFYIKYVQEGADETVKGDKKKKEKQDRQLEELKSRINNVFEIYKLHQQRIINLDKEGADNAKAAFDKRITDLQSFLANSRILVDAEEQHDKEVKHAAAEREIQHLEESKKGKSGNQVDRINENIKILENNLQQELLLIKAQATEKRFQLEHDYYIKLAELQKAQAQQERKDEEAKSGDVKKATQKIADEIKAKEKADQLKEIEKEKELKKKLNEQLLEDDKLAYDLGVTLIDAKYERELNAIQKLIDANNKLKETETNRINSSTLSAQEKANQLIILDRTVAANNEKLLREQRAIKLKEAKFDRDAAVLKILAETAVAAAKFGFITPMGIAVEAAGILQAGLILAKPLPTYGEGTKSAAGGPIIIGEKRKGGGYEPEYVEPKDGHAFWTSKPMLMNGLGGATITPLSKMKDSINFAMNADMMRATAAMIVGTVDNTNELKEIKQAIEHGSYLTAQALRKQKGANVNVHIHGSWNTYIDKNCRE